MIRVRLKKKFESKSEAWEFILSLVEPGNEMYFETTGKATKVSNPSYENELKELGLVETEVE